MKRVDIVVNVAASCENCSYAYLDEASDELICSESMPHQEVEEDNHCSSWKINTSDGLKCLAWSDVLVKK